MSNQIEAGELLIKVKMKSGRPAAAGQVVEIVETFGHSVRYKYIGEERTYRRELYSFMNCFEKCEVEVDNSPLFEDFDL